MELKRYLDLSIKLILIISIFNSITYHLWHLMSTSIFLLILVFSPQLLKKYYLIKFPNEFQLFLLIFSIITVITGRIGGSIASIFFGIGIGLISLLLMFILYSTKQIKKNYFLITLFSFNFAMSFGIILELIKYYLKIILNQNISNGTYVFAMQNLTYVFFGALIASLIGIIYMKTHIKIIRKIINKFQEINSSVLSKQQSPEEIKKLISKKENSKLEFKSTLRLNLHTKENDKKIEHSTLKTICAFLNSNGGTLFIGIDDSGKIIGIKKDNFKNVDKFQLHFINLFKEYIGKNALNLIETEIIKIGKKEIFKVDCKKSKQPIFLKNNKEEEFFIRAGPSSIELRGSELINYVKKHFKKNQD